MLGSKQGQGTPQETIAKSSSTTTTPISHTKSNTTFSNGPIETHKIKPTAASEVESTQDPENPDSWFASFLWDATKYGAVDPPHTVATLVEPTRGESFVFEGSSDILDLDLFSRGETTLNNWTNCPYEIQKPSPSQKCNDHKPADFSLEQMERLTNSLKSNHVGIPSLIKSMHSNETFLRI